jgi:hypothetical protein
MNKTNFTYNNIREDLKSQIMLNPFSCTYEWIVNWINLEITKLPPGSIILEMGTFVGGTTQLLAKFNKHVIIHTVDLNKFEEDSVMLESIRDTYNLPLLSSLDLLEIQKMHIEDFSNIIAYTGDSKSLDLKNISLVFVDASHDEDDVIADLNYAWDRLLDDGCIFGDDIDSPMVYNAFAKFARTKDVELTLYSKCARIRKTDKISPDIRFAGLEISRDILIAKL